MPEKRSCCMILLATVLTGIPSGDTETISKSVCLGDAVKLFEHISLANRTIVINHIHGDSMRQIARWFMKDSTIHSSVDKRFERIASLDKNGTVWIRKAQDADEGKYTLSEEDSGAEYVQEVELNVLVAPGNDCKPNIRLEKPHLIAFLNVNACGRPPASGYWLGYTNLTAITIEPGKEAGPYYACIGGPSLKCARGFKGTDFCSPFKRASDEELLPKISLVPNNLLDSSIKLQCETNDKSAWRFRWRRNGILINNDAKYNQTSQSLIIRHLSNDDKYDIFTCLESGGRFESDPYSIKLSGPSFIQIKPNTIMVNERDKVEVRCSTDCYPLCSVEWIKLDPSSGHKKVFGSDEALTIINITRGMTGNYSCKVQNLITGTSIEGYLTLDVHYGPDEIMLNTSNNIIEVAEFDSITILCTAECFPPCLISWNEMKANTLIGDAELKLVHVSANGSYRCIARNPVINTSTMSKTINISVKIDEAKIPKVEIFRYNISASSVVLQCHSFRKSNGKFSWRVNGYLAKHSDRYSPDNDFLSVKHLTTEDQNNSYTCIEPGTKLQSDPFWIKTSGPTCIKFNPEEVVVEEHNGLNVSCLTDCYPVCSFHWFKLDPSSGRNKVLSEKNALQITNMSREMSGNYSCKVRNIITGAFNESTLSLDVLYGPDEILLNTSNKITEVDEFDSITIACNAKCFPPCLICWTESYRENIILRGAYLKLVNVKSDATYTCHATNPKIANATVIETVAIKVNYDTTLVPRIVVDKYNESGYSVILMCRSYRTLTGRFSWRVNGSMIINSDRYFEDNMFLFVRQLSPDDQYNAYTCTEPGSGFQSDPFSMKTWNSRQNKSSVDKDREPIIIDLRYLVYAVASIGGIGVIVAVVFCLRKKNIHCSNVVRVSNDTIIAQPDVGEIHQEESSSEHYWTIITNATGKLYTALERNIDVELREFVNPSHSARLGYDANTTPRHRNSYELEVYSHSFNSDSIDIDTSISDSIEREGYIIPIPSDPENEYIDPTLSHHADFNEYINPIPSDPNEFGGFTDPSSDASKEDNRSTDDSITSYPGMRDECTDPIPSDAVKRDTITD